MLDSMSQEEFTQWHIFHNSEHWQKKLNNTPEGRSQQILNLVTTGK